MGITIHYRMLVKDEEAVEAIVRKWEERYMPELNLAGIPHRYSRIDEKWYLRLMRDELELRYLGIDSYEELVKRVEEGRLKILKKIPTLREYLGLIDAKSDIITLPLYLRREWRELLRDVPDVGVWRAVHFWEMILSTPPDGVEDVDYISLPCKGFIDTPETTESFCLAFVKLDERWYAKDFIKTQAFTDEEVEPNSFVHMLICDFLKDVEGQRLADVRVHDEGDYYTTGKAETLLRSYGATYAVIQKVLRMLAERRGGGVAEEGIPPKPVKWKREDYYYEVDLPKKRYRILRNEQVVQDWADLTLTYEELVRMLKREGWSELG